MSNVKMHGHSHPQGGLGVFILLTAGIFVAFLVNGVAHEAIFRQPGFENFGWFLTFVQFVVYVCLSGFQLRLTGEDGRATSWSTLLVCLAIFNVAAMGLTNASVGYMNYPTQLMFKSCKVISVMAAGIMILRKRYRPIDFVAVFLMTVGLVFFTMADITVSPMFQTKGVVMVIAAVLMDGIVGIFQENLTQRQGMGPTELVFEIYSIGAVMLFAYLFVSGDATGAITLCIQNWSSTVPLMGAFALTGYIGVWLVLKMIEIFGALPAVIVTTSRKAITIVLSFLLFNKPFTDQYIWSGLLILLGIYLNAQKTHFQSSLLLLRAAMCPWGLCKDWSRVTSQHEWIVRGQLVDHYV